MVMELLKGGSGLDLLRRHLCGLPTNVLIPVTRALADGINYMHKKGFAHMDLKPENFMFSVPADQTTFWQAHLKITDFALVFRCLLPNGHTRQKGSDRHGAVTYMAPEVYMRQEYDPGKADVWSYSVILLELTVGPLPCNPSQNIYCHWSSMIALVRTVQQSQDRPKWIGQLLFSCLRPDPFDRPSMYGVRMDIFRSIV